MNISVIIPNHNGEEILKKNLPKVIDAVGNAEVIVVDDASTDNSMEILNEFKPRIKIIKNEKNLGFSLSVNRGVEAAKGEIVVLLNTDVIPEKDFLEPLLSDFKNDKVFAVGCMDKSVENGKTALRGRGIGRWNRGFLAHSRGEVNGNNTLWVAGGSGAFKKNIWKKLGGMNELYSPFYWEDIDLSYRALKSGYEIIFEPKSVVLHEHEKGAIKSKYSQSQVKTIAYRNQIIFVWKNITDFSMKLNHILWLPYYFFSALMRGDVAFIRGFFDAFILLPKIVKFSNIDRRSFVLKDSEVLTDFESER
jgi:GT2 family glycosyltransferase